MAVLLNYNSGESVLLNAHHIIGRSKSKADTRIEDSVVSLVHASFRWSGSYWELLDHSRNGTWLNGERFGQSVKLGAGDRISFNRDKSHTWILSDDSEPKTALVGLTEKARDIELEPMHALPNEEQPQLFIFKTENESWVVAESDVEKPLLDGDVVTLGPDLRWCFRMASPSSETFHISAEHGSLANKCIFEFSVSADEEHTCLKLIYDNRSINLGERVYHYLTLLLARKKLEDHRKGISEDNIGWVDISDLQKMLGLDYSHVNIHIFRARQQLKTQREHNLNNIELFERRFGGIRFAAKLFQISHKGETVKYQNENTHSTNANTVVPLI